MKHSFKNLLKCICSYQENKALGSMCSKRNCKCSRWKICETGWLYNRLQLDQWILAYHWPTSDHGFRYDITFSTSLVWLYLMVKNVLVRFRHLFLVTSVICGTNWNINQSYSQIITCIRIFERKLLKINRSNQKLICCRTLGVHKLMTARWR